MSAADYHDSCHHKIYKLTCDQFDELWAYTGGFCQICGLPEEDAPRGRLCIDHMGSYGNHVVRGLLCDTCNMLMMRVDTGIERAPRCEVYDYMSNAWFSRMLRPTPERCRRVIHRDSWVRRVAGRTA